MNKFEGYKCGPFKSFWTCYHSFRSVILFDDLPYDQIYCNNAVKSIDCVSCGNRL